MPGVRYPFCYLFFFWTLQAVTLSHSKPARVTVSRTQSGLNANIPMKRNTYICIKLNYHLCYLPLVFLYELWYVIVNNILSGNQALSAKRAEPVRRTGFSQGENPNTNTPAISGRGINKHGLMGCALEPHALPRMA